MFGYVKPDKAELKIKEYETYKAIYCSLCKTLGREYGLFTRFFLTYDATFYIIFMKSIFQTNSDCVHRGVCRFNPLKKCNYIDEDKFQKNAAALTVIMFYYKLKDSINDGSFFKRMISYLIYPYVKIKFKKAEKNYSQYNDIIKAQMIRQAEIEDSNTDSIDLACDPSAKSLSEIFTLEMQESKQKDLASRTAYCIGRWVYLMDAYDDIENDLKSNSFNPYINSFRLNSLSDFSAEIENNIIGKIRLTANEAALAFEKLEKSCYGSVVENIIFDGMENELNSLIMKKRKKRGEKIDE